MSAQPRPLAAADLPGLLAVQRACYRADLVEGAEVFARRLASPAQCSLVLAAPDGTVCAYLAAYRSRRGHVTPLHGDFAPTPGADTLYLHDLAVLPAARGRGLAGVLVAQLLAQARAEGLAHAALVAVQGAQAWWQAQGFAAHAALAAAQRQRLAGYGPDAAYLLRAL